MAELDLGKVVGRDGTIVKPNLLDNSDFRNPVNQRGQSSYTGVVYGVDRWRSWKEGNVITVNTDCITLSGDPHVAQYVNPSRLETGKTYTVAVMKKDGTLRVASDVYPMANSQTNDIFSFHLGEENPSVTILGAGDYIWAALYEGEYTADTLPGYIPKGYAAELTECMRYYQTMRLVVSSPSSSVGAPGRMYVNLPISMRITPTVDYKLESGSAPDHVKMFNSRTLDIQNITTDYSDVSVYLSADL